MDKIFIDENGDYGLDYSNAIWASDRMHQIYHNAKVQLADADFLIENEESIIGRKGRRKRRCTNRIK